METYGQRHACWFATISDDPCAALAPRNKQTQCGGATIRMRLLAVGVGVLLQESSDDGVLIECGLLTLAHMVVVEVLWP